jgi:hypothetical protein
MRPSGVRRHSRNCINYTISQTTNYTFGNTRDQPNCLATSLSELGAGHECADTESSVEAKDTAETLLLQPHD